MNTRSNNRGTPSALLPSKPTLAKPKPCDQIGKAKLPNDPSKSTFNIESIVCGDSRKARSGMTLLNLKWYASERTDGVVESYYEVDPDSIELTTRGGRSAGNWRTRAVTDQRLTSAQNKGPRINIPKKKRKNQAWIQNKLRDEALKRLAQNSGCALSVGGPGERAKIKDVEQYLVRDRGEIFVKQNDGNCMTAAITNAIDIVAGREISNSVNEFFLEENPHYLKIREATMDLHGLATGVDMCKLPKSDQALFKENPFAFLSSQKSGVFIVHVFEHRLVSHTIVVDAGRQLVIDSAEDYPMRLSEELLRKCGGEKATALRVGEVCKIVLQRRR